MKTRSGNSKAKYNISRHFIISSVLIVLLLIGIPLITVFLLTRAYDDQTRIETNQISTSIRQTVQTFINGAYKLCYELAVNPSILSMDADVQTKILTDTARRNDYLELLYITGMDGMQKARSEGELGDRSERWWFKQIVDSKLPFVSQSYYSITTGMPCTAMFIPMFDGNEMIGVFGADLNLGYIQRLTDKFTHPDNGCYSFIIDGEGVVIAHPDSKYLETLTNYKTMTRTVPCTDDFGKPILNPDGSVATEEEEFVISDVYRDIIFSVMNGNSGQSIVAEDGSDYYISYEPIALPGASASWSVVALHERSAAMSVIYELVAQVLLLIMLILVVFIILIVGFFKSLRRTLDSLENIRDEADERTRIILNASPRINILFNSKFEIIDCNPAAVNFMGFETKEDMLAGFVERVVESIPPVQSNGRISFTIQERLGAAEREGNTRFETEIYVHGDLRILDVDLKKVPYGDSFAIVGYIVNMTDIRARERDLIRAHEQNEVQLAKLKLVVQATKIVLWDMEIAPGDTDPVNDARPFLWSDEFRHLLGFTDVNDFPNLTGSFNNRMHPADRDTNIKTFEKHLLDKTGKTPYDTELRIRKKNGEYGFYRVSGETIRNPDGSPIRVAGALMDITETKHLIQEIEKQRIAAETANKAKSSFLSTMSHEIRTPMNAILGITEIQLQNESLDPNVKEAFDKIYGSGDLLLSIINDILDLSKIEAGKLELLIDKYEIASLVNDTVQLYLMHSTGKPLGFELFIDEKIPAYLSGDELRIKQIMNNLLSNAYKYTARGMVKMSVTVETRAGDGDTGGADARDGDVDTGGADARDGDVDTVGADALDGDGDTVGADARDGDVVNLVIQVSDTGQGMTKQEIGNLFDEYARFNLATNRTTEGTGLGMSITRNLISLMSGDIIVESEPNKGSVFTVYLPQGKVGSEVLGKEAAENISNFRMGSRAQMRRVKIKREPMPYGSILLVDDVETNIYVAKGLLSPYKLSIDSAGSGFAAIEKVKGGAVYDIIFMDHMMPKMDGVEAVGIIRDLGYEHPIVALTANAVSGQAEKFREKGFDDFLSKPIDLRELNAILNKFIRDKQLPEVIEAAREEEVADSERNTVEIAGLDTVKGLKRFNNDRDTYKKVLCSYVKSVRSMLDTIADVKEDDLTDYRITVHGIKGSSYAIYADQIGRSAEKLEKAAKAGDYMYIEKHNAGFCETTLKFINSLEDMILNVCCVSSKPQKDKPERTVLVALFDACRTYDMDGVDTAIAEIRKYQYESDGGLADWLFENVDILSFEQIAERLTVYLE